MANRHLLAINKLEDFRNWLLKNGWQIEETKGKYEVLRARKSTEKLPLIVYKKDKDGLVHLSVSDWNTKYVYEFINDNKSNKQTDLKSQLDQANEKLNEHNEYFKAFNCKDFKEFQDFISSFMLTPHEEQTLIKDLQNQLNQANERLKGAIVLPVKIGDTIYVVPSRTNYQINIINNKEEKNKVSEFVVSEIRYNKYGYSVVCYIDYIPFYFNYETAKGYCEHFDTEQFYGETWFATLKEAKKKLQELRGGE